MQFDSLQLTHTFRLTSMQALYGGLYTEQNVAISGIHTHSGPGGYLQFVLYDITSLGFVPQSYDALVYGILEVILDMLAGLQQPLYSGSWADTVIHKGHSTSPTRP